MGRPKLFDPKKVLVLALNEFWKNGYEATSMSKLLEAMKISPQSFYNTFGNKESLYLKTMELFTEQSKLGFKFTLRSKEDASLPEIIRHFAMSRSIQLQDSGKQSCYISNSVLELGYSINYKKNSDNSINHEVTTYANKFFKIYADSFKFAVENGIAKKEISNYKVPSDIAFYLVNAISGIGILNKSGFSVDIIDNVIITNLSIFKNFKQANYFKEIQFVRENILPNIVI